MKVVGGRGGPAFEAPQGRLQCQMTRPYVSGFSLILPEATLHTPVRSDLNSGPAPPPPPLFGRRSCLRCYRVTLLGSWRPGKQSHRTGLSFPLFSPPSPLPWMALLLLCLSPTSSLCQYPNQLWAQMMPRSTGLYLSQGNNCENYFALPDSEGVGPNPKSPESLHSASILPATSPAPPLQSQQDE